MAVLISGKLIGPNGDPRPGVTIMMTAVKTSSTVVHLAPSSSITGADGSYSLSVEVGTHNVMIEAYGRPFEKVGQITVYSDSKPGTLNAFLNSPGQDELSPAIVAMVDEMRAAAAAYAEVASDAAMRANVSAENSQNNADANTYYTTAEDPDGTIAGLAGTPDGKGFRVALKSTESEGKIFIYYRNVAGVAEFVNSTPDSEAIRKLQNAVVALDVKATQATSLATYSNDIFPRAFNIGDGINLPGSAVIKISSISIGDISLFIAWYLSLTSGSEVARRWFLPPNTMYIGGELKTNFNRVRFSDLFSAEIAEVSDAIIRVRYQIPGKFNFTPSADMKQIHDLSGVFASMNYSSIAAATERGVSNHQTVGAIQFVITPSEMTAAGYNPTDNYSILSYLGNIARNCEFLTHPADADFANVKTYNDVSQFFQYEAAAGDYVFQSNAGPDIYFDVSANEKPANRKVVGGAATRKVADLKNECSQGFSNQPMELRVKFAPGEVPDSEALFLTDKDGNEYPCQFAGEDHINLRKQLNMAYHADGSLASGSVLFEGSLASGEMKYLDLQSRSFPKPRITSDYPQLKWYDSKSVSLDVNNVKYIFSNANSYTLSRVIKSGNDLAVRHTTHFAVLVDGVVTTTQYRLGVSIRVVNSGPVFTEVEVVGYNPALGSLAENSLKVTTVYRIFKSGRVRVYSKFVAVKQIPVGVLFGVHSSYNPRLASGYTSDYKRKTMVYNGALGRYSIGMIHTTHDVHRDGTNWGPDRTYYDVMTLNSATAGDFTFGWRYTSATNYSFLNWPVEKDWAWSMESWVDLNETLTDPTAIATRNHNRPVGYLNAGMWPSQARKSVLETAGEISEAILEFLDTPAAAGIGGSTGVPDNRRPWTPYATHIYNYIRYGMRTLNDIFEDFKYRQYTSYGISWINPDMGARYLAGRMLLQFAASDTIIAMEWIYRQAEREGNTAIMAALKAQLSSMGDALITAANAQTVKLCPLDGSMTGITPPSNAGTIGMRFLALAIYAGADTDGRYLALFNSMENIINTNYVFIENILGDGYDNRPTHDLWMSYTHWTSYFYLSSCALIGRTPLTNMSSFTYSLIATAGHGALRDIDMNNSESRRGKTTHWLNAVYILLYADRTSTVGAAKAIMDNVFSNEWGPQPGYPGRFCGFLENTQGGPIPASDVPFLAGYLSDMWLHFNFKRNR